MHPEFVNAAINATGVSEAVQTSLGRTDEELRQERRQAREERKGDDVMSTLVYPADQREEALREFEILGAPPVIPTFRA